MLHKKCIRIYHVLGGDMVDIEKLNTLIQQASLKERLIKKLRERDSSSNFALEIGSNRFTAPATIQSKVARIFIDEYKNELARLQIQIKEEASIKN
jgi:hypothetical protein